MNRICLIRPMSQFIVGPLTAVEHKKQKIKSYLCISFTQFSANSNIKKLDKNKMVKPTSDGFIKIPMPTYIKIIFSILLTMNITFIRASPVKYDYVKPRDKTFLKFKVPQIYDYYSDGDMSKRSYDHSIEYSYLDYPIGASIRLKLVIFLGAYVTRKLRMTYAHKNYSGDTS